MSEEAALRQWPRIGAAGRTLRTGAELVRVKSCVAVACYTVLSAYVASPHWLQPDVLGAALVVALIVGAAFALNDVADLATDRITKPERPLPSRRMSNKAALGVAVILAAGALATALSLGTALATFAAGYVLVSAMYSLRLKSTILGGNVTMACLIGSVPLYAGVALDQVNGALVAAAAMLFWFSLAQEILFTLEDRDGDLAAGLTTTATHLRRTTTIGLFRFAVAAFVVAALLPPVAGIAGNGYLAAVCACTLVPLVATSARVTAYADARTLRVAADRIGALWWTSLVPLLLLR